MTGSGLDSERPASLPASAPAEDGLGPRNTLIDRDEFMSKLNVRTQGLAWLSDGEDFAFQCWGGCGFDFLWGT